jgi:hypothetical protein
VGKRKKKGKERKGKKKERKEEVLSRHKSLC